MGKVYANGMEVCSGSSGGKSVAAMPDVCFTQPMAPPTPQGVPIPYPASGMASDIQDGSTTVKIGGKPVALKDKSYFKKVTGNEAGNAGTKGLVSQTNTGEVFFAAWSMNVKVEGLNVVRHMDLCTLNHASQVGNTPPWPFLATMKPPTLAEESRCQLRAYKERCPNPDQTPHHCVPDHCFREKAGGSYYKNGVPRAEGLCICVDGATKSSTPDGGALKKGKLSTESHYAALAEHGRIHKLFDYLEKALGDVGSPKGTATIGDLEEKAAHSIAKVTGCDPQKIQDRLREFHDSKGLKKDARLRADPFGKKPNPPSGLMGTLARAGGKAA